MIRADDPDVSVIVPVFRNASTLAELHDRIVRELVTLGLSYEMIFVDDASDDGSATEVRQLVQHDSAVRLLALPRNVGQQQAVLGGMREARGRLVATLDADLQDPPEALGFLVSQLSDSVDVVFAGRRGAYESRSRLLASRMFKRLLGQLTTLPADAGMFLVMKREIVHAVLNSLPNPFYLPTAVMTVTKRVRSVPVTRARRSGGVSQYTTLSRARLGFGAAMSALRWRLRKHSR